ncbi:MAG TPA: GH1 family beta-glucosidase [Capsulimonadaceae bacterium]|jgi:beta-glucosidase
MKYDINTMDTDAVSRFPADFVWGAAAASYQIEGAWDEDGKGPSVWDMFGDQAGRVFEGHTGKVACDHYHLRKRDVALMRTIGLKAYRFSVSWPRVMPSGTGKVNKAGLDFYDKLVDDLLECGIDPWVTLFHWDYPYDLFLCGGWLNPESPAWFAEYVAVVVSRLSDRVSHWITLNEPQCFIGLGHLTGEHAPGLKLGMREVLLAGHHCLLAHGRGVQAIREHTKLSASIGWAPVGVAYHPATRSEADIEAARQAANSVYPDALWNNTWWGDPIVLGHYPEDGLRVYGNAVPKASAADFDIIHEPIDFYGSNIYSSQTIAADPEGKPVVVAPKPGNPRTLFQWSRTEEALYWGPKFLAERYKLPIIITENGMSGGDWVAIDGHVHDSHRVDFLTRYLRALGNAVADGVDVRGYFHWSILDNFEWAEGYKHRFGLIHVDYETQKRVLKDSAFWYRKVILSNGASLETSDAP